MKKGFSPVLALVALLALLAGCAPPQEKDVRPEAFAVLAQINRKATERIDVEIARLGQLLDDVDDRTVKLEQILPQTEQWLEAKKAGDYSDLPCG